MKKTILILLPFVLLTGCADKNNYEEAVLKQMKTEKDVADYHIDPQHMTDCVVDLSTKEMPGLFPADPYRMKAYRDYTQMLTLSESKDPKQTLENLRKDFGSAEKLAKAHANYTESVMNCFAAIIMESEGKEEEKSEQK